MESRILAEANVHVDRLSVRMAPPSLMMVTLSGLPDVAIGRIQVQSLGNFIKKRLVSVPEQ